MRTNISVFITVLSIGRERYRKRVEENGEVKLEN